MRVLLSYFSATLFVLCFLSWHVKAQNQNNDGNEIEAISIIQEIRPTGRGNEQDVILKVIIFNAGDKVALSSALINLDGTSSFDDICSIKIFTTKNNSNFDERGDSNAILIGNNIPQNGDFVCSLTDTLYKGINYLWLCCSISAKATEGNFVDASFLSLTTIEGTLVANNPFPAGSREILLARKLLFVSNDYGSKCYRIPAIITAKDGSLVTATDKRKNNQADLPQDIDILIRRSVDNGITWSEPVTIAGGSGSGKGFGDAALALTNEAGGLICVFVGGDGLWESVEQPDKKIRSYMCKSYDNGITWTTPTEITDFIYGGGCTDAVRATWKASFFGSGHGLQTTSGRIMFVAAIRETAAYTLNNYVVYSDDDGKTWQVGGKAADGGDEAKMTELADGRILMSIRHHGNRWYNISDDGGITWQSSVSLWTDMSTVACNGDLIRYTATTAQNDKNILLHSIPDSQNKRENVSIFLSSDEGKSWTVKKCVVPYGSAYSSLTILNDGTIGLYVEENYDSELYSMYFLNFSLKWLTEGKDSL